jgi:uncharacterized membrane protein
MPFLDWMRGLAAVIMLQGHTFHSFTRNDLRNDGPYVLSQFFGGIGPAVFLFLTGITYAFIMQRGERSAAPLGSRWLAALKRARYLFILAILFRLQLWLFAWPQPPAVLLKVDILNCMALTMLVLSPLALVSLEQRIRWAGIAGLAIAVASPLISLVNWSWVPGPIRDYYVPSYDLFAFFPWAAFLALGVCAGSILKSVTADQMNRLMQWSALLGFGLLAAGRYFSDLPYSVYPKSEFWLNSPWLVACKTGALLLIASFAYLWNDYVIRDRWSWVRQLGTTSLLVYWVHIELVYGKSLWFFKESLNNYAVGACAIAVILLMLGLSILRTRWSGLTIRSLFPPAAVLHPRRVSGD